MSNGKIFIAAFVVCFFLLLSPVFAESIVDLTYPFNHKTIYWPTAKGFELTKVGWNKTPKGYFYAANLIAMPEHGGTHLDAPIHFAEGCHTVDQIPLEQLLGEAAVIDLVSKIKNRADYLVSKKDIEGWEKKYGLLHSNHIVFFKTGWGKFWGNKKKYLGSDKFGDVLNLHFPGISKEAALYLVSKKIKGVGLDTPSLDSGPSRDFWAHRVLLGANIYGLENVASLEKLPPIGARVIVAPMKIEEGTGAPARVLGILP